MDSEDKHLQYYITVRKYGCHFFPQ